MGNTTKNINVWDFVEKFYPDYSSSSEIAHALDLDKIIKGELSGAAGEVWKIYLKNNDGKEFQSIEQLRFDFGEVTAKIYEASIIEYLRQEK